MIFNITGGGTTTTKIINVESKDNLPEKARHGSIAIISSVAPGEVYVQDTEPESPAAGDVWMVPAAKSKIIYVSKGEPRAIVSIRQYINGVWTICVAYQFINGAWPKELYLLKTGDLCEEVTGGWTAVATQGISVVNGDVRLYNTSSSSSADYVNPAPVNTFDLSDYDTLYFNVTSARWTSGASSNRNVCRIRVFAEEIDDPAVNFVLASTGLHAIDVSALTGVFHISFMLYSYHGDVIEVYTDGLWLE